MPPFRLALPFPFWPLQKPTSYALQSAKPWESVHLKRHKPHGLHSPWPRPSLLVDRAAAAAAAVVAGQDTLLYFERHRNQAKLSVWPPSPTLLLLRLLFSIFLWVFAFFICHNSVPKRAAVFPRVALFLVVVDIAFITFRFIHLFHCSLLPSFISDSAI